jgi:hypothetical protein
MKEQSEILKALNPNNFWDVNLDRLDMTMAKRLIIERIFSLGSIEEMLLLLKFYGKEEVLNTLSRVNYLDPKTLNFVSVFFDKPKENFKCYTQKLSANQHWNS